jgi:hypothetical protein
LLNSRLVVTGLRCDGGLTDVSTPIPPEKAFIISVHLRDLPFHELRLRDAVVHRMTPSMKPSAISDPPFFLRSTIRRTLADFFSITSYSH